MLEIVHVPLGIEDPYRPLPWERAPREPEAGQQVAVGITTRPPGAAWAVRVSGTADGATLPPVAVRMVSTDELGDHWQATIGPFAPGVEVAYRGHAEGTDDRHADTATHTFLITSWRTPCTLLEWQVGADIRLWLAGQGGGRSLLILSSPGSGELAIRFWPLAPTPVPDGPQGHTFDTLPAAEGALIVQGAGLRITVGLGDARLSVVPLDEAGGPDPARPAIAIPALAWLGAGAVEPRAVRVGLQLEAGEALYGTGERFDSLDRRGKTFDCRVYEQYKDQGSRTYLPVPMLLSSRGYALAVEGTRPLRIDAGAGDPDLLIVDAEVARVPDACLALRLFLAATPLDALGAYLRQGGLPVAPPDWAFGLWMSANDWNSQERVLAEVARGEREGIPGDVVVIEAWADEATFYIWNDAQYDPLLTDRPPRLADFRFPAGGLWPDPKGMVEALHEGGARLVLWQIPLMKPMDGPHAQNAADAELLIERGWCATNPDGSPYRNPGWWFPGALLPDLTSPEATAWWLSRRRYLVEELGVDGFKTDGGEHLWGRDVRFADGRRGDELINDFPVLYAAAYHALLADCGRTDGLTFSRAGYAGSQRSPLHWAGDEDSTWDAFRHSIVAGLSAGASGIPFWGWDIAGFSGDIPSGELYRRAWMMATFCPIMQYHSEFNDRKQPSRDRTPWNIAERTGDPDVLPVCRRYAAIRRQLRPYLVREGQHSCESGRPLMCALPLAFPADPRCRRYPYQYLLGRDLLVAPTVDEGATSQRVYLPEGRWRDLWTEKRIDGPAELTVAVPAGHIPVYVREGAAPPLQPDSGGTAAPASPSSV